jgi:heat-inducible transcriptional repressor
MSDISERKREVLFAVVENYIVSAEPVGSTQVSKMKGVQVSSATIRHVMSELEELGYLSRPHSSAGGVPTERAYRFYVDRLMQLKPLTSGEMDEIARLVKGGSAPTSEIMRHACHLISERTQQPGLALAPYSEERSLRHIQFVRLKSQAALAILVSSAGIVENKVIELDQPYTQAQLNEMHNLLNSKIAGKSVAQLRQEILQEIKNAHDSYNDLLTQALILSERVLSESTPELHIEGQSRLCSEPEFASVDRMRAILRTLEEKTVVLKLLDQSLHSPGVKIFIGDEIEAPEVGGLSLITSTYSDSEGNRGVLGVLGPARMNYARIVPLVDFTSRILTQTLGEHS